MRTPWQRDHYARMDSIPPIRLDASTLRRLAVEAHVDPRTISRAACGERIRGDAGHRAREALERHGYRAQAARDPSDPPSAA
jgi:hypothetical protein